MYGANETAIDGDPQTDVRYIRITDIDADGNLQNEDWKTARKVDEKYALDENDILFARSGATAGKAFIYKREYGKAIFAGYMIRFRFDKTRVHPLFVFYYTLLSRYRSWVRTIQRPSGQPNINSREFKAFEIPLPPLDIQNHIVEIIQSAYAQKKQKEQAADTLLGLIDDYVLAELGIEIPVVEEKKCFVVYAGDVEGRVDPSAYRSLKTSSVNAIKSSKYKSVHLEDVVVFRKEIVADAFELPYVGLENIESNTGFYVPSNEEKESFNSALKFESGDVLFPKLRPYLNKVHFAKFNGVCSTEFHVLKGKNLNNLYLFAFLKSKLVVNQTTCLMTGNTLPRLQTQNVQRLPILLPPLDVQEKIADEMVRRQSEAAKLRQEAAEQWEVAKAQFEAQLSSGEVF